MCSLICLILIVFFFFIFLGQLHACNICTFKTFDKPSYDEHLRKHVKLKPFKCRICSARFESREQAGIHAKTHCPDYFKCGTCSMSFPQRDLLIKHFDTHKPQQAQVQQKQIVQQIQQPLQDLTTQKLLQETIDEALRDTGDSGPKIHFFSCHICSLTFIQETYYKQHMETHKRESNKKDVTAVTTASTPTSSSNARSLIRSDQRIASTPTTIIQTNQTNTSISDSDLESMFEKMHSDKTEIDGNTNNAEGLVITSQESSTGGYTFNITMPTQHGLADNNNELESVSLMNVLVHKKKTIIINIRLLFSFRKTNKMMLKAVSVQLESICQFWIKVKNINCNCNSSSNNMTKITNSNQKKNKNNMTTMIKKNIHKMVDQLVCQVWMTMEI